MLSADAAVAVFDWDSLATVDPDADRKRELEILARRLAACLLELERGAHGLRRRVEHGKGLVASELDHPSAPSLDGVSREIGELRRETRGASRRRAACEGRVSTDVAR